MAVPGSIWRYELSRFMEEWKIVAYCSAIGLLYYRGYKVCLFPNRTNISDNSLFRQGNPLD